MGPWDPSAWEAVKLEPATLRPAAPSLQGKPKPSVRAVQLDLLDGPAI
jgi:hypothetical protein